MPRGKPADLTGQTFNMLTAVRSDGKSGTHTMWLCKCSCGSEKLKRVRASELLAGTIRSCGCIVKEQARRNIRELMTTHGQSGTRVYQIWLAMKNRCLRESNPQYKDYGGRGIEICERWLNSFENFYADMGDPPDNEHTIERRNNDGNYEPGNCCWATRTQQSNNKRTSRLITHGGRTQTVTQWSRELGIPPMTIHNRLRRGWTVQETLRKE